MKGLFEGVRQTGRYSVKLAFRRPPMVSGMFELNGTSKRRIAAIKVSAYMVGNVTIDSNGHEVMPVHEWQVCVIDTQGYFYGVAAEFATPLDALGFTREYLVSKGVLA